MREPKPLLVRGDIVRLRGRTAVGILREVNERGWASVDWNPDAKGAAIVHIRELELA